jgi:hypothetical protein
MNMAHIEIILASDPYPCNEDGEATCTAEEMDQAVTNINNVLEFCYGSLMTTIEWRDSRTIWLVIKPLDEIGGVKVKEFM